MKQVGSTPRISHTSCFIQGDHRKEEEGKPIGGQIAVIYMFFVGRGRSWHLYPLPEVYWFRLGLKPSLYSKTVVFLRGGGVSSHYVLQQPDLLCKVTFLPHLHSHLQLRKQSLWAGTALEEGCFTQTLTFWSHCRNTAASLLCWFQFQAQVEWKE